MKTEKKKRINPLGVLLMSRVWELDKRFETKNYSDALELRKRGFNDEEIARYIDIAVEEVSEIVAFEEETLALSKLPPKKLLERLKEDGYEISQKGRHTKVRDTKTDVTISTF